MAARRWSISLVLAVTGAVILAGASLPSRAAESEPGAAPIEHPWEQARSIVDATEVDIKTRRIAGIEAHVPDLERALADAKAAYASTDGDKETRYVLVDGAGQALVAVTAAAAAATHGAAEQGKQAVVAVNDPYPAASFYLGTYYNEAGKPLEALRVLDAGLALPTESDGFFIPGEHQPMLISERGTALVLLKRWPDALAAYDSGLAIAQLEKVDRARMFRGRGFALTEMGRLDEAETAYREALKLQPDDERAKNELQYIARIRAGGDRWGTAISTTPPQKQH